MMARAFTGSASRIARHTFIENVWPQSSILRSKSSYLNGIARKGPPIRLYSTPASTSGVPCRDKSYLIIEDVMSLAVARR
jgi:hypothetical protein